METNELPEEVKKKIEEKADEYGFVVPYDGSNQFYKPNAVEGFQEGAEFGYRLALQSKEEELNRFKKEIELLKLESDNAWSKAKSLTSEVERLRALCDKGDRILRETDSYALRIDSLCRVLIKVREALESQSFLSGNTNLVVVLKQEIDTLLSQSTDKQP